MATLTELEQQLAELTAKVDAARADLRTHAAAQIKLLMAEYGVSAADLVDGKVTLKATKVPKAAEPKAKSHKAKANGANGTTAPKNKGTRPAKYIDPDTGATWSGMGHTPAWLKDVKNREKYLIQ